MPLSNVEWLTTEGNFAAYSGNPKANKGGKSKSDYHKEIDAFIKKRTGVSRGVKAVEDKINSLERCYKATIEKSQETGYGLDKPGNIRQELKDKCPYFDELDEIMAGRPNVLPLGDVDADLPTGSSNDGPPTMKSADVASAISMRQSESNNQEKDIGLDFSSDLERSTSSELNKYNAANRATASRESEDLFDFDETFVESENVVNATAGLSNSTNPGELGETRPPKQMTSSHKTNSSNKFLVLPPAKKTGGRRGDSGALLKSLLDEEWKQNRAREMEASAAKMVAEKKLILAQAEATRKDAAAKEKLTSIQISEAAVKAKQASNNLIYDLVRKRQDLVNLGVPTEDINKLFPLPPDGWETSQS